MFVTAVVFAFALATASAQAQHAPPPPPPPPPPVITPVVTPLPFPVPSDVNSDMSAGSTVANLGSNFLERLGQQATYGFGSALRNNPGGGGASEATDAPRFRMLGRDSTESRRRTARRAISPATSVRPGAALPGSARRIAPGVNVGVSVDQSHTAIDVPLALQSAGARSHPVRLQRLGRQGAVDLGGRAGPRLRKDQFGPRHRLRLRHRRLRRPYRRRVDRAQLLLELDQSRIVPKAAFEYVRAVDRSIPGNGRSRPGDRRPARPWSVRGS